MKKIIGVALILVVVLFALPFVVRQAQDTGQDPQPTAQEEAALPDSGHTLRVKGSDGQVTEMDLLQYLWGVVAAEMPASFSLEPGFCQEDALRLAGETGYPLFVKPVRAGSSYGVSKVYKQEHLLPAISAALRYDDRVLVEACIGGSEVGCAVMGTHTLITGEIDQISLGSGFFDYTEKYNLITAKIHVPAPIPAETAARLKETAKKIYRVLGCSGFARVDMFLTGSREILFHEVNTIPGFTPHSRFPNMMEAAGIPLQEVITRAIEEAVVL